MSWRDRIAKAVAGTMRTDLTTPAYHGTWKNFQEFKTPPVSNVWLDRGLGTHVAKDPRIASEFADRWVDPKGEGVVGSPQVHMLAIPAESRFMQVPQPAYDWALNNPSVKPWEGVMHDEHAIDRLVARTAYQKNPEMLTRYLMEARAMPEEEAKKIAGELVAGKAPVIEGKEQNLERFVGNYGGRPFNQADRELMTELARKQWQDEGYVGLRYTNTSPREAGAQGVIDPTSYIVFDPKHIRSQFAEFSPDPQAMESANLLRGFAPISAIPVMGEVADQSKYEAMQ